MLFVVGVTAQAQQKTLLETEVLAKQLELSAKQKTDLDKQLKEAKAEKEAMQVKIKAFQEEMKRDAFVKRQEREAKMKSILTPEQLAKWQELKKVSAKKMRAQRGQRGDNPGRRQFRGQQGNRQGQGRGQFRGQLRSRGQGQFQGRALQRGNQFSGFSPDPQQRQEMRKRFQEFMKQEQEKKEKGGDGN